jgi:ribonuclease HI
MRWAHASCAAAGQDRPPQVVDGEARPSTPPLAKPTRVEGWARRAPRTPMPAAAGALRVWTDGACSGNPGPGGWAWATEDGRQASGGALATTNQRMEIQAALEAVQSHDGPLIVVSDSIYVVNCFRDGWWRAWLACGWLNSGKKPVANRDLWEPLIIAVQDRADISFHWVKGHSGDPMNDLVDRLAVEAVRAIAGSAMAGGGHLQENLIQPARATAESTADRRSGR